VLKNLLSGRSKRFQVRGAREIDERRRTYAVRWSEAIEGNEADEPCSTAWQKAAQGLGVWLALLLMLGAIVMYVLSLDDSIIPR
jgi:hypothetical protein